MTSVAAALLHQGGWDEVIMVAVGLLAAFLIVTWTGKRRREGEDGPSPSDQAPESRDD
ncbi:MAG: hypothetical protein U0821_04590 [Chloroflexota bacterium]